MYMHKSPPPPPVETFRYDGPSRIPQAFLQSHLEKNEIHINLENNNLAKVQAPSDFPDSPLQAYLIITERCSRSIFSITHTQGVLFFAAIRILFTKFTNYLVILYVIFLMKCR